MRFAEPPKEETREERKKREKEEAKREKARVKAGLRPEVPLQGIFPVDQVKEGELAREREAELLEKPAAPPPSSNAEDAKEEEEEETERIYNPLKLPLGWDGKPIPYWLYKLHGLGVEYRCEICSDHVYMGR